jgi:thiopurine S-methyltransferase
VDHHHLASLGGFWLERWRTGEISFHKAAVNPRIVRHWPAVGVAPPAAVFVPLCGKTLDMRWLAERGHDVLGVELSPLAVEAYFADAQERPTRSDDGLLVRYQHEHTTLWCGDFFALDRDHLASVGAVYDRGALVALPADLRRRYVEHLLDTVPLGTRMLLLTVQYDQTAANGPPFAVHEEEIERLYGARCRVTRLEMLPTEDVSPRLRASGAALTEAVHLIEKVR